MDAYVVLLAGLGLIILLVAWLPLLIQELPLSLPIACVAIGFVLFWAAGGDDPHPLEHSVVTERLAELVVIIALMGAGLRIERPLGWRRWAPTWRLLAVTMPLSITGIALAAGTALELSVAAAVLVGAVLAPTDPVLAADVQLGPPKSGPGGEARFTLTSEAGLNDGLAFPFTHLALAMAAHGAMPGAWTLEWLGIDVLWRVAAGLGIGWAAGRSLGVLVFRLPRCTRLADTQDGFVSLGITFLSYGLTELAHGYGFLAVFVTAVMLRQRERGHAYHQRLHDFSEQSERLLMMVLLVLFGGSIAGGLLDALTWPAAVAGIVALAVVRPLTGLVGLAGSRQSMPERLVISVFGIRGLGSFYYLAFAMNRGSFERREEIWAFVGFVVLVSIVVHGVSATPVMRWLDRRTGVESSGRVC